MSKNISDILAGQKVAIINNHHEKTILTIAYIEPSRTIKVGICVVFTNGTYENIESIFDIAFV